MNNPILDSSNADVASTLRGTTMPAGTQLTGVPIGLGTANELGAKVVVVGGALAVTLGSAVGHGTAAAALRVELPTDGTGVIATVGTVTTVTAVTAITNALPAGANAIGKLAANSGIDIGSVGVRGANNLVTSQVTSTGTAATLAVARSTRRSVLIRNTDTANSIWVGPATVTTGNGALIKAGESMPFTWVGLHQVIDNGSHAVVVVADEYD